jgi:hypothetical protein
VVEIMAEKKAKIESFSSKSNNKIAFLMLVEDPSVKIKFRGFVGANPTIEPSGILFKGYEINWSDRDKITSFEDALLMASKKNGPEDAVEIRYPWGRVISVRNICYKRSDL